MWFLDPPFRVTLPGAQFDRARKAWVFVGPCLPDALAPFGSAAYSRLRWLEDDANGLAVAVPAGVAPKTPRALQLAGAAAISSAESEGWRQFLLCDDVGTGKTITMWLAALEIAARRAAGKILVLVDRPAAITIPHWRNTIAAIGDGGHRVLISSPDQLPKLLSRNGRPWARWDIVIADECHLYRHTTARRTQVFRRVARFTDPHAGAPFVMLASATPGQHPAELTYLAPVLAQLRRENSTQWSDFGGRLAAAGLPIVKNSYGTWGWNETAGDDPLMQQSATARVRGWLADNDPPLTLHRAAPWGPTPLDLMPVDLDPAERVAYQTMWSQFRAAIAALAGDSASGDVRLATRSRSAATAAAARGGRNAVLRFRQKASLLRVGASAAWVAAQVEAGYQVAVSCEFLGAAAIPLAEALQAKGLSVARIHGAGAGAVIDLEAERIAVPDRRCAGRGLHAIDFAVVARQRTSCWRNIRDVGIPSRIDAQCALFGFGRPANSRAHPPGPSGQSLVGLLRRGHGRGIDCGHDDRSVPGNGRYGRCRQQALTRVAELLGVSWLPPDALTGTD